MNLKFYLRGLGIGIIVTAVIMLVISSRLNKPLSDEEIKLRAGRLGMVEADGKLTDVIANNASQDQDQTQTGTEASDGGTEDPTNEKLDEIEQLVDDADAYLEEKNENEIKSAKGKEQENVSAVPVDLPIFIEFPGNIEGSYTFNVYSGDKVLYTKPVICDKNTKENEVYFDTKGTGSEIYTVKVRRNGVEKKDFY